MHSVTTRIGRNRFLGVAGILLTLSCIAAGPATAASPAGKTAGEQPPAAAAMPTPVPVEGPDYKIGPGDLLAVTVYDLMGNGTGGTAKDVRVGLNGNIKVPMVPQISAAGLNSEELEAKISKAYDDAKIIHNGHVDVMVMESVAASHAPPSKSEVLEGFVLPGGQFGSGKLEDLLSMVHDVEPAFNGIAVREPGVSADYPELPKLELKNITIGQLLGFLRQTYQTIEIGPIEANEKSGILYTFHITGPVTNAEPKKPQVFIYRLTDDVNSLGGSQKNMDDILSLVQKALEASQDTDGSSLKVHPETQTLIFRGTGPQIQVVANALNALKQVNPEKQSLVRSMEMESLRNTITAIEKQNVVLRTELEALRKQLPTTRPKE